MLPFGMEWGDASDLLIVGVVLFVLVMGITHLVESRNQRTAMVPDANYDPDDEAWQAYDRAYKRYERQDALLTRTYRVTVWIGVFWLFICVFMFMANDTATTKDRTNRKIAECVHHGGIPSVDINGHYDKCEEQP